MFSATAGTSTTNSQTSASARTARILPAQIALAVTGRAKKKPSLPPARSDPKTESPSPIATPHPSNIASTCDATPRTSEGL